MSKSARKGGRRRAAKNHVGAGMGIAGFVGKLMLTTGPGAVGGGAPAYSWLIDQSQSVENRLKYAGSSVVANLKSVDSYYPLAAGALVSIAPRVPLLRVVAGPVDRFIAKSTRGKWGL